MRNHETQIDYANTDPSLHYNRIETPPDERWRGAWLYCLKYLDYESAELIHDHNIPPSDECHYGDHDLCHFSWCNCVCHQSVSFPLQGAQIKSCREVESEREQEREVA